MPLFYPGKLWCPDYSEDDFLKANYNYGRHAWMRLVLHHCDPEERALEGKDCADIDEINEYTHKYIFSMSYQKMTPTIDKIDIHDNFKKYYVDADYSTPINNNTVVGKEFNIIQNDIILDDQMLGIYDHPSYIGIIDVEQSLTYIKPNTGSFKGYVYYYNFILSPKSKNFYRISYTFLEVLGQVGGLLECYTIFMAFLLIPFKYNITKIRLLKDYLPE